MSKFSGFEKNKIENTKSDSGDDCHKDIIGVDDKDTKKFVKDYFKSPNIFVCCKNEVIQVGELECQKLKDFIKPCSEAKL